MFSMRSVLFVSTGGALFALGQEPMEDTCPLGEGNCGEAMLQKSHTKHAPVKLVQEGSRAKHEIETDLRLLDASRFKEYQNDKSCSENAEDSFDYIEIKKLTKREAKKYKKRVVSELCTIDPEMRGDWVKEVREATENEKPVMTEALAAELDARAPYHIEMQQWMESIPKREFQKMLGTRPELAEGGLSLTAVKAVQAQDTSPATFESATEWPQCSGVFMRATNQGVCGSCWAFAALSSVDSRLCVYTNGAHSQTALRLSRGDGTSCSTPSGNGCDGGWPTWVFNHIESNALASQSCVPYWGKGEGTDHFQSGMDMPPCSEQCEAGYTWNHNQDAWVIKGLTGSGTALYGTDGVAAAKVAISTEGPIPIAFSVQNAFFGYKNGVYEDDSLCGDGAPGPNHAVTLTGWGSDHWIGINSWDDHWGDNGGFKMKTCIVTHYIIPGSITSGTVIPAAVNDAGPTPPPPAATPAPTPAPLPMCECKGGRSWGNTCTRWGHSSSWCWLKTQHCATTAEIKPGNYWPHKSKYWSTGPC